MQQLIAYNKRLSILTICILLCACTGVSPENPTSTLKISASSAATIDIPSLPSNWGYIPCPHNLEKFSDCDFEIPLPKGDNFDAENYDYDYFWNAGYSKIPSMHFTNTSYYNPRYNSMTLTDIACEKGSSVCRKPDYIVNKKNISIARFHANGSYGFFIKTPAMVILVTDPSIGANFGPQLTAENIGLLETSLLNIRVK